MTVRQKGWLIIGIIFIIIILLIRHILISDKRNAEISDKKIKEYVGNVQFKGKVINSRIFDNGKPYLMVCVKLDYSNYNYYKVQNEYCFLKIKDNIATMAVGFYEKESGVPKYVEVNINHNGIEKFFYSDSTKNDSVGLNLANYNLTASDLNTCN